MSDLTGVLSDVLAEAVTAKATHGDRSAGGDALTTGERLAALVEEVGEVGRAIVEDRPDRSLEHELLQVAAVACMWVEQLRRTRPPEDRP